MVSTTTIQITSKTWERLINLKRRNDNWNDVICSLFIKDTRGNYHQVGVEKKRYTGDSILQYFNNIDVPSKSLKTSKTKKKLARIIPKK